MSDLFINKFKFKKNRNHVRLLFLMILFASLNLTGCFYGVNIWGKELNELNTDLDRELWLANRMNSCFSSRFINERMNNNKRMNQSEIELIERYMTETFQHFFPAHTPLTKVTKRLVSEAGAKCINQISRNNDSSTQTICSYSHISLVGMKKFRLTGWEIYDVYWQKNNFEFAISSQDDHLTSSVGKVLEGECYDIDLNAYKTTNTIKFIRKIP